MSRSHVMMVGMRCLGRRVISSMGSRTAGSGRTLATGVLIAAATMTPIGGCGGDEAGAVTETGGEATEGSPSASDAAWTTGETADGTWAIAWRPVGGAIPPLDPFSVEVVVRDPSGGEIPVGLGVLVDATMPHHGHGMNVEPRITRRGDAEGGATFIAEGMLLHMPGRWEFTVDVVQGDEVERAQWTVMLDD